MPRINKFYIPLIVLFFFVANSCNNESEVKIESPTEATTPAPENIGYAVLNAFPHDTAAFTQGLELYKGKLIESTGLYGKSSLRHVDIKNGKILKQLSNEKEIFAEGVTILNDTVYQLSWENHLVFLYDAKTIQPLGTRNWNYQGWGITNDGKSLIISDGTDKLYFTEPNSLKVKNIVSVKDNMGPVNNLNELEMIEGYVYANRWQYDYIVKIDPKNGNVVGTLNFSDFLVKNSKSDLSYLTKNNSTAQTNGAVLNGIAYDSSKKTIYITGKLWPEIFEIKLQ
jgi:glutamine cyclotransferase